MTRTLLVSEMFGPTVQGEGPSTGRRCAFLRLGLCNLDCSWCDTPYTWDWHGKNGTRYSRDDLATYELPEVATWVRGLGVDRLVCTGGEPLLQQRSLAILLDDLADELHPEVETNGTILPSDAMFQLVDQWNVSPKLPHSGVDPAKAWKPDVLRELVARAGTTVAIKVVCQTPRDVEHLAELVDAEGLPPALVWVMPEGRSTEVLVNRLELIADRAVELGFNLTTRLHVHTWGDRRGR